MVKTDIAQRIATLSSEKRDLLLQHLGQKGIQRTTQRERLEVCRTEAAPIPLSFAQQRLWFLEQMQPGESTYHMPVAFWLEGPLDLPALQRSFQQLQERHEILRTSLPLYQGSPIQDIRPSCSVTLDLTDLSHLPVAQREATARQSAQQQALLPFDLQAGPLWRASLCRLEPERHFLLVCLHHSICDGWSLNLFFEELTNLYQANHLGTPSPLAPLTSQYADYAIWQRQCLQGERLQTLLDFWQKQVAGVPALLEFPSDYPRPTQFTQLRGATHSFWISAVLLHQLQQLAKQAQVTLYMLLLATFEILLARWSGQQDLLIGTALSQRPHPAFESVLGLFVNTLPIRSDLAGNPSLWQLLQRVRQRVLEVHDHQELPLEQLVEVIQPPREMGVHPLFQAAFIYLTTSMQVRQQNDMQFRPCELDLPNRKLDLTMAANLQEEGLQISLEYNLALFQESSIVSLGEQFVALLEDIIEKPHGAISQLSLLNAEQRQALLRASRAPILPNAAQSLTGWRSVISCFEQQVERYPDHLALSDGVQTWSYRQLNETVNRVARLLQHWGVGPEVRVGLQLPRSGQCLLLALAVLKAGGAYVPLDPSYPAERLAFMQADAKLSLLVREGQASVSACCQQRSLDEVWEHAREQVADNLVSNLHPEQLAYLIYTSGSTGKPKGVLVAHRGLSNVAIAQRVGLAVGPRDRIGQCASLNFDASVFEWIMALLQGASLHMNIDQEQRAGEGLLSFLQEQAITIATLPPSLLASLPSQQALSASLRTLVLAGEAPSAQQVACWGRGRKVYNAYGPTETTIWATLEGCQLDERTPALGQPISQMEAYVLDEALELVPPGTVGELYLGGIGLARGYEGQPALTAERFVPHPFSEQAGARLYRTGDLACRRADSKLEFAGRCDRQVKLRGYRIELGEIERVLETHPAVRQAVVSLPTASTALPSLTAYLLPLENGSSFSVESVRHFAKECLPGYMLPANWVKLERVPLTVNGKIDYRKLPTPALCAENLDGATEGPITLPEELLASLWRDILYKEHIGRQSNFFDLGGHSLLAMQLITRIRSTFHIELSLRAIFEAPTLQELAQRIEKCTRQVPLLSADSLTIQRRNEKAHHLPLSSAQQRLWFLDQLKPGEATYIVPEAYRVAGPLSLEALRYALAQLIARHESLRTTFFVQRGQPFQCISSTAAFDLPIYDLTTFPQAERAEEALRQMQQQARHPFDLQHGPLLRCSLWCLEEEQHLLLICMHHIVSDGWSMKILFRELLELYHAHEQGVSAQLEPLPLQYTDYALWQREWQTTAAFSEHVAYWRQQLAEPMVPLELPTDYPRPAELSHAGDTYTFTLAPALTKQLKQICQQEGITMYMLLLTAFQILLARYSGQTDILVGTPIANRTCSEIENVIGFFVNTLALRSDLAGDPTVQQALQRVRDIMLDAYAHQDVPFEHLVETLQPERHLNRNPFFQVMFVWEALTPSIPSLAEYPVIQSFPLHTGKAKFDLTLFAWETDKSATLTAAIEYSTELFEATTIARMAEHFEVLLDSIPAQLQHPISRLPLLTPREEKLLLHEWNTPKACTGPVDACLHALFAQQAQRRPEAPAIVCQEQVLTYQELDHQANQLAHYLQALGVGPEVKVGLYLERSLELVIAVLAILKAGGAYVPLDPNYPQQRVAFILADARVTLLITQSSLQLQLAQNALPQLCLDTERSCFASYPTTAPESTVRPENLAYVIYTSGSTGKPKGTLVTHANVVQLFQSTQPLYALNENDVWTLFHSIAFDFSVWELWGALSYGGLLVIVPYWVSRSPEDFYALLVNKRVTVLNQTPSAFRQLQLVDGQRPSTDLRVRLVIFGGEALDVASLKPWYERHGDAIQLVNMYGITETTVHVTARPLCAADAAINGPSLIGHPLPAWHVYLLDKHLQPVPVGIAGEVYIGGAGLSRGYLGRPELTAERFIPNPFSSSPGDRLYKSGDMARCQKNGELIYLGRSDHQVKLRGFRLEPGEIETLLRQQPSIKDALVVVRGATALDQRLVAYICVHPGDNAPSTSALRAQLKKALPDYMVPSAVVPLEAIPLTANGKLDYQRLPEPPQPENDPAREGYQAPQTELERLIVTVWQELLHREHISVRDNFFELGGHSLSIVQLHARLLEQGLTLSVIDLFKYPTIQELVENIGKQDRQPSLLAQSRERAKKRRAVTRENSRPAKQASY